MINTSGCKLFWIFTLERTNRANWNHENRLQHVVDLQQAGRDLQRLKFFSVAILDDQDGNSMISICLMSIFFQFSTTMTQGLQTSRQASRHPAQHPDRSKSRSNIDRTPSKRNDTPPRAELTTSACDSACVGV